MAFSGGGGGRAPLSEINVTPLVDVMLVLLIIFMVAAPLLTKGVPVELPQAEAPRLEIDEEKLILSIDAEGAVYLGETLVPAGRLQEALSTNARLQEDGELFVRADAAVPYGRVLQVLAAVRQAGVERLGLVTDPASDDAAAP
jgi:biopolymer transport protein TolR